MDNNPLSSIDPLGLAGQSSAAGGGLPDGTVGKPTASTNSQLSDKYDDIASSIEDESVRDFLWGIKDGVLTQIDDLIDILKHPGEFLEAILDLLIQIFKDPEAVLEVLLEELEDDLKRLIYCGAYERGKVIGENITPVIIFKVLKKLIKKKCSFRGDMLVLTSVGYIAISSIQAGIHEVFAKDEFTGEQGYREVLDQYSNPYDQTVYVEIEDGQGNVQTIVSNRVHPFYVEGEWKRADGLVAGDKLTAADGAKLVVRGIRVEQEALQAYNLSVAGFHSYFVKGIGSHGDGVWVHNGCGDGLTGRNWEFDPKKDWDLRGRGDSTWRDGVDKAFEIMEQQGLSRDQFKVTKWSKDKNGKSIPVEWEGPDGAQINMDTPNLNNRNQDGSLGNGPHQPHIGYQTPGKRTPEGGGQRGHIFVNEEIPATR